MRDKRRGLLLRLDVGHRLHAHLRQLLVLLLLLLLLHLLLVDVVEDSGTQSVALHIHHRGGAIPAHMVDAGRQMRFRLLLANIWSEQPLLRLILPGSKLLLFVFELLFGVTGKAARLKSLITQQLIHGRVSYLSNLDVFVPQWKKINF